MMKRYGVQEANRNGYVKPMCTLDASVDFADGVGLGGVDV